MEAELDEYAKQAHKLVDRVIESSISKLENNGLQKEKTMQSIKFDMSRDTTIVFADPKYEDYDIENIDWLSIEEFTVEKAEEKINEFIKTWDYQDSWEYCVDYLGEEEHEFDNRYRFRVRWSIPTRRKPIPRSTACVYFTFQVSKIKPKDYAVDVLYVFEGNRLVHKPGESRFREKWLKDIIESKVVLMEQIDF